MILLEAGNRLLADLVRTTILPDPDFRPIPSEAKLADFDNSSFLVQVLEEDLERVIVSLELPAYKAIKDRGVDDALKSVYGSMLVEPRPGYDVTISVGKEDYAGKEEEVIELISRLKRVTLSGIFEYYLAALSEGTSGSLEKFQFDLRKDTTVYFLPQNDRVTVFYRLSFLDKADNEIGRVFLREFADPSLRRKVQRAPIVEFDPQPFVSLKQFGVEQASPSDLGFVSFTMLPSHCKKELRPKVVESLQIFRNFVQYHLKCAKAYFHSRMRFRVAEFVRYLNRAKRNTEANQPKRILTAGGKLKLTN